MRRSAAFRRKYGLTVEAWEAMLAVQGSRCPGCGVAFGLFRGSEPHVDHCHRTGAVRGLLCGQCNKALGLSGDSPKVLRASRVTWSGMVQAHRVLVELILICISPYPSPLTSISTVVLASSDSASSRKRAASIAYMPPLVIIDSQIRDRA